MSNGNTVPYIICAAEQCIYVECIRLTNEPLDNRITKVSCQHTGNTKQDTWLIGFALCQPIVIELQSEQVIIDVVIVIIMVSWLLIIIQRQWQSLVTRTMTRCNNQVMTKLVEFLWHTTHHVRDESSQVTKIVIIVIIPSSLLKVGDHRTTYRCLVTRVSRPPVPDYGTTFHLEYGGRDLPLTLLKSL